MRKYYIADTEKKVRLGRVFNSLSACRKHCEALNRKHVGRYQCGDWVNHNEVGKDVPNEYTWQPV